MTACSFNKLNLSDWPIAAGGTGMKKYIMGVFESGFDCWAFTVGNQWILFNQYHCYNYYHCPKVITKSISTCNENVLIEALLIVSELNNIYTRCHHLHIRSLHLMHIWCVPNATSVCGSWVSCLVKFLTFILMHQKCVEKSKYLTM